MAGHSKWANIKRRKGAQDAKRGKLFTKIIKEINVAVRTAGEDPDANPRLRLAIQSAKSVNMPKDNIDRAVKKAAGIDAEDYQETTYEGYAPHGIPVMVECTTDNIKRTVQNVRAIFNKCGGSLGTNGSVEYLFERRGIFTIVLPESFDKEALSLEIIDAGAEDIEFADQLAIITTAMDDFGKMQQALDSMNMEIDSGELHYIPTTYQKLDDEAVVDVLKLLDAMEDDEDVKTVYHNLEIQEGQENLTA